MRYNKVRNMDISNGPGVRVSIFMQGCAFNCKNCFNPETHDFAGGKPFTDKVVGEILDLCDKEYIEGLSILGGEPMHPKNISGTEKLAKAFKERFPQKTVWVWSGFLLVDGQFVEELKNPKLEWKGSSNQRVIDVQKSLKQKKIVLYKS